MQQIINFILRYRNTVLYLSLAFLGIFMTIRSHSYHQSKFFNSSKWVTGNFYNTSNTISSYFSLREENKELSEENKRLRQLLFNNNEDTINRLDTTQLDFQVLQGRAIKNSYALTRNYITIDLGKNHGVEQDMGVITSKGILGIVENTSRNYSTVQSILNSRSNINAKIKNTNYFGSLVWDGDRYDVIQLVDIPRLVPLVVGDTIVTGGMSSIFPENIPIGTIKKYELNTSKSFYDIDVALFNDMANIYTVYVIKNNNRQEILQLETKTEDVE
ncbi:rod shape-determining protein MreC [Allomuricauda sp. d1]|uniref:rod shape-determining protein MreC n=1 Tax=Allomuricauda sp. d1 TaxID=3136725 RepID=UPI0031DC29EF